MLYELFPSIIYKENITSEIQDFDISKLGQFKIKEGHSIDNYVLDHKDTFVLKNILLKHITIYTKNILEISKDLEFYITRSWITQVEKNDGFGSSGLHNHENSFFTAILYFNVEEESDSIIFAKTKSHQYLSYEYEKINKFNQQAITFHPKKYDFIIFDASLFHQAGPVISHKTRNSLALEIFARGTFGKRNVGKSYNVGELILK